MKHFGWKIVQVINLPTDEKLFQNCDLLELENMEADKPFEYLPCQKKFRLRPEDEISLESIFSALLSLIEPSETCMKKCQWEIDAKIMLNEKQSILFEETLFISKLRNSNCKLSEETKIFLERELREVGQFHLSIEESYDGYVVFNRSKMLKGKGKAKCGHSLRGKYDDKFALICEKRTEFYYVDNARIEKSLEARSNKDKLIAVRENRINGESQKFKAVISMKGREEIFVLDGGVQLLMRYLIINNFVGEYNYYSMNIFGKIIKCNLCVHGERKTVRVFFKRVKAKCVIATQFFNDVKQEVSETYFTSDGRMVLHFWHDYNYVLHSVKAPAKPPEKILPKLELMWKKDNALFKKYRLEKKLNYENAYDYLTKHSEATDLLHDYILSLLKYKPTSVLEFTIKFFQNMKNSY